MTYAVEVMRSAFEGSSVGLTDVAALSLFALVSVWLAHGSTKRKAPRS